MNKKIKSWFETIGSLGLIALGVSCVSDDPDKVLQVAIGFILFLIGFINITLKMANDEK